jgi:myo-inositol catabolism protein IolC
VGCIVGTLVAVGIWDAHLSGKRQLEFEQMVFLEKLAEAYRQAEHERLLELIEAMKPRRDLTLPAEPDEGS